MEGEGEAAAQTFRRRAVAKDQLPDGPVASGIAVVEHLRVRGVRALADRDDTGRRCDQVQRPVGTGCGRRDENRAVIFGNEADRRLADQTRPATPCLDPGRAALCDQVVAEARVGRQRVRCQDLPSVATAGA